MNLAAFIFLEIFSLKIKKMNKKILQLAFPSIVSNITVPLLGLIDVAIVGHLGATSYIGAIAIGGMLFNIIYWLFGFLRMGTSGLTSQALGKRNLSEVIHCLFRSLGIGFFISFFLLLFQYPIQKIAFILLDMTQEVEELAVLYFRICIWGAPAVLGLYGFSGWFIGMQNSRFPMYIAITQNLINIFASLFFVFVLQMKVEGVALGTLVAQYGGFLMALLLFIIYYWKRLKRWLCQKMVMEANAIRRFFKINSDIFFRTLCLVGVTTFFTSTGAKQGEVILAVNTLLMQLFTLFSYIMDGFAYAGEALTGRYVGASNRCSLNWMIRLLFRWGIGLSILFTLLYGVGGKVFLSLLTYDAAVIQESAIYFYWVLLIPLAGFAAFLWDGILIGATATRWMLYSMLIASSLFFFIYYILFDYCGNHALWIAFLIYLSLRGLIEWWLWRERYK